MPHKHKRKREGGDQSDFNLPPSQRVKSLPTTEPTRDFLTPKPKTSKRRKVDKSGLNGSGLTDDTPKAFARLMAWHQQGKKLNPGLDDGNSKAQKRDKKDKSKNKNKNKNTNTKEKVGDGQTQSQPRSQSHNQRQRQIDNTAQTTETPDDSFSEATARDAKALKAQTNAKLKAKKATQTAEEEAAPALQILPGESMSSFSARVDQSLPLSSVPRHNSKNAPTIPGVKNTTRLTKHNKRLAVMQKEWRATEAKLRAKELEADEDMEEEKEEESLLWAAVRSSSGQTKGKKAKTKAKAAVLHDDPWKELEKRKREEQREREQKEQQQQQQPPVDASKEGEGDGGAGTGAGKVVAKGKGKGKGGRSSLTATAPPPPVLKKIRNVFKRDYTDGGREKGKYDDGGTAPFENAVVVDVENVPRRSFGKNRGEGEHGSGGGQMSLRRREELSATRRAVIEAYRKKQQQQRSRGVVA